MSRSTEALVHGNSRYENVAGALQRIASELNLEDAQSLLIKPSFMMAHRPLSATHTDAVRAVLDFARARYASPITVAEGPVPERAAQALAHYGHKLLAAEHGARLLDPNDDEPVLVEACDRRGRLLRLHLARTVVESDYRISVGPLKTHDAVIATLSIKNMGMGSLISRLAHPRGKPARQAQPGCSAEATVAARAQLGAALACGRLAQVPCHQQSGARRQQRCTRATR
jgi:uncharacterized protein (DUF362 family)